MKLVNEILSEVFSELGIPPESAAKIRLQLDLPQLHDMEEPEIRQLIKTEILAAKRKTLKIKKGIDR